MRIRVGIDMTDEVTVDTGVGTRKGGRFANGVNGSERVATCDMPEEVTVDTGVGTRKGGRFANGVNGSERVATCDMPVPPSAPVSEPNVGSPPSTSACTRTTVPTTSKLKHSTNAPRRVLNRCNNPDNALPSQAREYIVIRRRMILQSGDPVKRSPDDLISTSQLACQGPNDRASFAALRNEC